MVSCSKTSRMFAPYRRLIYLVFDASLFLCGCLREFFRRTPIIGAPTMGAVSTDEKVMKASRPSFTSFSLLRTATFRASILHNAALPLVTYSGHARPALARSDTSGFQADSREIADNLPLPSRLQRHTDP